MTSQTSNVCCIINCEFKSCHYVSKQLAFQKNIALIATDKDGLYTATSSEGT